MFKKFVAQRGVTLCCIDGRIKRQPLKVKYSSMDQMHDGFGDIQLTRKEYNNLVKGGAGGSFYITSDSQVFQQLTNPKDERDYGDEDAVNFLKMREAKNLPKENLNKLQIKSKYRYEQLKYLSNFQLDVLKLKEQQRALYGDDYDPNKKEDEEDSDSDSDDSGNSRQSKRKSNVFKEEDEDGMDGGRKMT